MMIRKFAAKFCACTPIFVAAVLLLINLPECSAASKRKSTHLDRTHQAPVIAAAYDAINRLNHAKTTADLAQVLSNRSAAISGIQITATFLPTASAVTDARRSLTDNYGKDAGPKLERDLRDLLKRFRIRKTVDSNGLEKLHLSKYALKHGCEFLSGLGKIEARLSQIAPGAKPGDANFYNLHPIIDRKALGLHAIVLSPTRVKLTSTVPLSTVMNGLVGLYVIKENGSWRVDFHQVPQPVE